MVHIRGVLNWEILAEQVLTWEFLLISLGYIPPPSSLFAPPFPQ